MRLRGGVVGLALLVGGAAPLALAQDAKRIYIAPDDHTDYLWSADEEAYRQAFVEMIDYYLDLADATEDHRPEHQSRWNCDGSLWLWTYEQNKTPREFERLLSRIRDGHISVPLNALVSTYGAQPTEAVLRGMYYPGRIERQHGVRFPIAIAMEDQTLPYGLGALWAGAGARYSWKGICGCATKIRKNERRPHEIYWWEGADGSRVLMRWHTLLGENESIGGYAEARDPAAAVGLVDTDPRFRSLYPYPVIGAFGKGWDDLKTLTDEFVTVAQAKTTESRKVIVSNQLDFFEDFEAHHGDQLPTMSVGFGNEWDLYSASMSEVSARVRRAVERLRAAEGLATLVALERPGFWSARETAREQAWMNLGVYWEHNWTSDSPVITRAARAAWQRRLASQISGYVDTLHDDAAYALGDLIEGSGEHPRFYVYNPLSWTRTDVADLPLEGEGEVHVVDLVSGRVVPSQLVRRPDPGWLAGRRFVRALAAGIPPVGYRVFEVRPGPGPALDDAATVTFPVAARGGVIESDRYRIEVEPRGAVRSWIDKAAGGRELVREVEARSLNDLGPGYGTLSVESAGPVSVTLLARSPGPPARETRITVLRDLPRVELHNQIIENFAGVESWAFGFAVDSPDVLLWSVKPAEEGVDHGIVARVWNLAPEERRFSLRFTPGLEAAIQTTHIETDRDEVPVSDGSLAATAAPSQLLTFRLHPR